MAPGYGQYNNYYDPVGSQANQNQGYAYQNQSAATSSSQPTTAAAYAAPQYPSYGAASYNSAQQYGSATGGQQDDGRRNSGATSAAIGARASGVNGHDTQASASRSNTTQQQETGVGSWGNPNYSASYNTSLQPPSRTQTKASPQYGTSNAAPASSFGRLSYTAPSQQVQSGSTTYNQQSYGQQSATQNYAGTSDTSRQTHSATQHHQASTEPSRYASPMHAVQAQQQQQQQQSRAGHSKQPSRSSNQHPSPVTNTRAPLHLNDNRQASASAEPANTTVDPSQVYDFRAEREKKAKAEAEKRRKMEEIEAAKKAEEARIAEEKRKADEAVRQAAEAKRQAEEVKRQAEEMRINEERRRAEQAKRKADEKTAAVKAAAKAEAERKKEEQRKASESKNAASTLASLATSSNVLEPSSAVPPPPPINDEEAEMRAMFQKMREFNSKNPSMLAKLWEEERRTHAAQSQSPQPSNAAQSAQPAQPAPKPSVHKKAPSSTPLSGSTATPAQLNVSRSSNATAPPSAATAATGPMIPAKAPEANVAQKNAPQANTHLWPPGKKGLLAEIAARWLHSMNPQRVITTTEILERLDMNPIYVQLCESLEAMGLRFERAAFARELLRGIPPAGATNQTSPKAAEAAIMSANGTVAEATGVVAAPAVDNPKPKRSRATKAEMEQRRSLGLVKGINKQVKKDTQSSNNGMVDYEMPSFSVPDAPPGEYVSHMPEATAMSSTQPFGMSPPQFSVSDDHSRQPSLSLQPERRSVSGVQQGKPTPVGSAQPVQEVKPPSPARPPADKEEAARKRGFGDLVDLTADDSDDGDLPPMKMMKASQGPLPGGYQKQHANVQRPQQPHQPNHQYNQQQSHPAGAFDRFRNPPSAVPSPQNAGSPFSVPGISTAQTLFMQPNGSFGKAPTAVMSAGTGPMPGPATPTLAKPPTVPNPVPQPPKRKGPTNEQLQHERIRGRMVVEPIMRDRVARRSTYDSRTIARDILLATGRHPDMRPLNSHLNAMQKLLGDRGGMLDQSGNKSDLATIKWDIIDPSPPKKAGMPAKSQNDDKGAADDNDVKCSTEVAGDGEDADDEEDETRPASQVAREGEGSTRGSAFDLRASVDANMKPLKIPKKRGRPPRTSAPTAGSFTSVNSPMESTPRALSGTPRQISTQPQSIPTMAPTGTPVGYAAFRQYDQDGKEIKKKGRPVGWRKSIHSREAQGLTPKKSLSAKPKPSAPRAEIQLQEPKYQVYRCQWLDCDAQLHSLEVLKKHVTKVHGHPDVEGEYRCRWRGCNLNTEASTPFKDISGWLAHIDRDHLQAVAWKLGDGPRGGLSGE